ncbi:hypothetical protein EV182_000816 [Spiromyces aspiralis]|uniref:Uncharacterized protein n=1 Tax=Spiromyces aspiralis TaxID=68401 RepID=A0ACC1HY29_9FUNG|nr:hypothetical protein EV182_000816 [Spiromyces aspiralis]
MTDTATTDRRLAEAAAFSVGQDDSKAGQIVDEIATRIESGDSTLLDYVQALQPFLVSETAEMRSRGTQALVRVTSALPAQAFQKNTVAVLTRFFCSRLTDPTCVPQLLDGVHALQRLPTFGIEEAKVVALGIFKNVHVQSFQQRTRNLAFQVIESIVKSSPRAVKSIGSDFVLGLAQMVDGEKDPRNLIIIFQLIPHLTAAVDLGEYAEDLFEVVFCYFPITFKQRQQDPLEVSPEDLKLALRDAVTSSRHLAAHALGPLVEKLEATSANVKVDVYDMLACGARQFDPQQLRERMPAIVELAREEVAMGSDRRVVDHALMALQALYMAATPAGADAGEVLGLVLDEAVVTLGSDDFGQFGPTTQLIGAVARSSPANCGAVADRVLPVLLGRLDGALSLPGRRRVVDALNELAAANVLFEGCVGALHASRDRLLAVYQLESTAPSSSREHSVLHMSRLRGIQLLVRLRGLLTDDERALGLGALTAPLVDPGEDGDVRAHALELVCELAEDDRLAPAVESVALRALLDALGPTSAGTGHAQFVAEAVRKFGASEPLLDAAARGLVGLLGSPLIPAESETQVARSLRRLVDEATGSAAHGGQALAERLYEPVAWALGSLAQDRTTSERPLGTAALREVALTISVVIRHLGPARQQQCLPQWFDAYGATLTIAQDKESGAQLSQVASAAICSCGPGAGLPVDDVEGWLARLSLVARTAPFEAQRISCCEVVASVINKTADASERERRVAAAVPPGEAIPEDGAGVALFCWVVRAVTARKDACAHDMARSLLAAGASGSAEAGRRVTDGYGLILAPHPWAVVRETGGVLALLHKQRFYSEVMPSILDGFSSASKETKTYYLWVLTRVFQHMPKPVLMHDVKRLLPLLIEALRLEDPDLRATTLETVGIVIGEAADLLRLDLTSTVIPLHLDAVRPGVPENSVRVRCLALKNLALIADKFTYQEIFPSLQVVRRALALATDDRKRVVRSEAVKTRNKWLMLGN